MPPPHTYALACRGPTLVAIASSAFSSYERAPNESARLLAPLTVSMRMRMSVLSALQ